MSQSKELYFSNSSTNQNKQFFTIRRDTVGLGERKEEFNEDENSNVLQKTMTNDNETGGGALLHDYAKKLADVVSCRDRLLDCIDESDRLQELRPEIDQEDINGMCRASDDEAFLGASLHDYAKKITKEVDCNEYFSESNFNSGRWREVEDGSNRRTEIIANYDDTGGGPSLHDYAKKVIDDNESFLVSFLDSNMFRETRNGPNECCNETTNYADGFDSLHDYAKKAFDDNEHLLESIFNPEMLRETRRETNQGSDEIMKNYVGECLSGHDYAKKGDHENLLESIFVPYTVSEMREKTNQYSDEIVVNYTSEIASGHDYAKKVNDSLFENILDHDMLRAVENGNNQDSSELCKMIKNGNGEGSLHDYAKKFIGDSDKLLSERFFNSDISRYQCTSKLDRSVINSDEICTEVHDYAKKSSNDIQVHGNLLDSIFDSDRLEGISDEFDQKSNRPENSVQNYDGGGSSIHNYAKKINENLSKSVLDTDKLEDIRNELDNDYNHICKLVKNDAKNITNNNCDPECLSENIDDIDSVEGISKELCQDSDGLINSVAGVEICKEASLHENDKNGINKIADPKSIDESGIRTRNMKITCLFCDATFESASSMYQHDFKYHYGLKLKLKMEDSEVRCKQCDELVVYSKIRAHLDGHLPEENKCQHCGLQFRSLQRLEMHIKTHINAENFCPYCGRQFKNNRNKLIHIRKVHNEAMDNLCDVCGLQFRSLQRLKSHLKTHQKTNEYFCSYCGKEFSSIGNKLIHMKLHDIEPRELLCEVCGRLYLDKRSLTSHQRLHVNQGDFICKTCTTSFQTEEELDAHVSSHLTTYSCHVCSKLFHHKNLVQQHMLSHSDFNPFSCFCGASFNRYGNFRRHMNKHERSNSSNKQISSNKFECGICKRNLKSKLRLGWHEAMHRGEKKPFDCHLCDCRFDRLEYYKVHMMKHTGERPYTCSICQKGFRTLHTLQQHTLLHMRVYPFKCDDCGQIFKQRNALQAHKVTHTGNKPYECEICGRRYTQKASLFRHLKQHTDSSNSKTPTSSLVLIEVEPTVTTSFSFGVANDRVLR